MAPNRNESNRSPPHMCLHIAIHSNIQPYIATNSNHSNIQPSIATHSHQQQLIATHSLLKPPIATHGYIWPTIATHSYTQPSIAIHTHPYLYIATHSYIQLAIFRHTSPPKATYSYICVLSNLIAYIWTRSICQMQATFFNIWGRGAGLS